MICGWVAFTWYASQNASWAIFQLAWITFATWACLKRWSRFHTSNWSTISPRNSCSDSVLSGLGLMKTNPAHSPTCASGRWNSSASTWGKSQSAGMSLRSPSSFQAKPWNGQRISEHRPE